MMTVNSESRGRRSYVLMTAAYNEEAYIENTIDSVLSQKLLPQRWVIVSDSSSDRTDEIVKSYANQHDFLKFLRVTRPPGRSFRSKVLALRAGSELLQDVIFDYIGNIDADISVAASYFEDMIVHFEQHPELGLAAGLVCEETNGTFESRKSNRVYSVPHAAQLVRRECYEAIGGYAVLKYGGEDWHAQTCARMKGWQAEAIPRLKIVHRRHTGSGSNLHVSRFRLGRLDYSFGSDPLFEVIKCCRRLTEKPYLLGAMERLMGFAWGCASGEKRAVSEEFVAFLRKEQTEKVGSLFSWRRSALPSAAPSISSSAPTAGVPQDGGDPGGDTT